jgi:hypothetical protein
MKDTDVFDGISPRATRWIVLITLVGACGAGVASFMGDGRPAATVVVVVLAATLLGAVSISVAYFVVARRQGRSRPRSLLAAVRGLVTWVLDFFPP